MFLEACLQRSLKFWVRQIVQDNNQEKRHVFRVYAAATEWERSTNAPFFSDPHAVCHGAIKFFMEIKLAYMIGKFLQGRPSSSSRSYYDARSVCGIVNLVVLVMRRLSVRLVYCIETDKD